MKNYLLWPVLVFFLLMMSACVHINYGPSENFGDATFVQSVQAVLDPQESIIILDKGYFLAQVDRPGPATTWGVMGTLVATDKTLYCLFWNRHTNSFDVIRKIQFSDIIDIGYISSMWGPGDYIVITDKDKRPDLFSCYDRDSPNTLIERNHKLLDYLFAATNIPKKQY
jgi:hypothetical protein